MGRAGLEPATLGLKVLTRGRARFWLHHWLCGLWNGFEGGDICGDICGDIGPTLVPERRSEVGDGVVDAGWGWRSPSRQPAVGNDGRLRCAVMSESLRLTIVFEDGEDGWVVASIPEVPGAHSQGRDRAEARENVIDALRGILELRFGDHGTTGAADSEPLELVIGG
jgi:predicted RNase H-like HicB family nuclease